MANRQCSSASPPLSSGRLATSVLADDCTLDTRSSQGARAFTSPRASIGRAEKLRRKDDPRPFKSPRRSTSASNQLNQLACYHEGERSLPSKSLRSSQENARRELRRFNSSPTVPQAPTMPLEGNEDVEMQLDEPPPPMLGQYEPNQAKEADNAEAQALAASRIGDLATQEMLRQLETNPITEEQLINEVRGIYAGLVMVEKKCIEVDREQTESRAELSESQWQALISLHRTLLHEHHDFFLASQHPSASPVLKRLAEKYAMPARMWRYGIHSFLELLRQKLPESLDFMLYFIYIAYSMMTLLLESVSSFRETWIECLGDLARYRMAVEESDMRDREVWAGVSRYWYNQDADCSPDVGRIQHHLAVLARPDALQQLYYYTKALVSVRPFLNARESIILLFNPFNGQTPRQHTMVTAFIATHSVMFKRGPSEEFVTLANLFFSLLRQGIRHLDRQGQQGVYLMSCNFASILQYGDPDAVMALEFSQKHRETAAEAHAFALEWTSGTALQSQTEESDSDSVEAITQISSQVAYQGSSLAFHTLSVFLEQMGDPNIYPSVHVSLCFTWCLALHPPAMQQLERLIPWIQITTFLNTLVKRDTPFPNIEQDDFPTPQDGTMKQLPEDFLIRGQSWSQLYYPEKFFEGAPSEDERPINEDPSTAIPRRHRCLWLGVRISTVCSYPSRRYLVENMLEKRLISYQIQFNRWIRYTRQRFEVTQLAIDFAPIAQRSGNLNSMPPVSIHNDG
ncbi:DNA/RNA-binding domain E.t1.c1-type [Penicillium macrosclerotiorum]|uniref:DNA/RNA-binding domain E.t1.c1-type n=1 Tax=Penicillium macrosclerotiorum TaxID=303699 RepID=UPI0025475991|nr:DNA/RNA-binding domain E.t1.c1-type [Penicillium macrosclerotiorum]KAJ5689430.1 DNA/RNA-binding domain E.t1.c1-type [Penicillium macrosclerotiorum]